MRNKYADRLHSAAKAASLHAARNRYTGDLGAAMRDGHDLGAVPVPEGLPARTAGAILAEARHRASEGARCWGDW